MQVEGDKIRMIAWRIVARAQLTGTRSCTDQNDDGISIVDQWVEFDLHNHRNKYSPPPTPPKKKNGNK